MQYWYETAMDLRKQDSIHVEMVKTYERITGIASNTPKELVKAFDLKNAQYKDCNDDLQAALDENKKLEVKKNFWKTTTFIAIPVCILGTAYLLK